MHETYSAPTQPSAVPAAKPQTVVKQAAKPVAHNHTAAATGAAHQQTKPKTAAAKPVGHKSVHAKAKPTLGTTAHAKSPAEPAAATNNGNGNGNSAAHGNAKKN